MSHFQTKIELSHENAHRRQEAVYNFIYCFPLCDYILHSEDIPRLILGEEMKMDMATSDYIAGRELEHLGLVQGSIVKVKNIGQDFKAVMKTIVGGEIQQYTELMQEVRAAATERMQQEAQSMRADAIIAVRYATAQIMDSAAEIVAYGTAVRYKK